MHDEERISCWSPTCAPTCSSCVLDWRSALILLARRVASSPFSSRVQTISSHQLASSPSHLTQRYFAQGCM